MNITLIRHLPTKWNKEQKLQGKQDIPILPITDQLKTEIAINKKKLQILPPPTLILSSSLQRTKQTAEAYGVEAEVDSLLNELDFGNFEGKLKEELVETAGNDWLNNPKNTILADKILELEMRIQQFLRKYARENHVLIFGHGSWIRAFISFIQTGSIDYMNQINLSNNEMNTFTI